MKTDVELSELWQMAHWKFHFGEKLAYQSIKSVVCIMKSIVPSADNQIQVDDQPMTGIAEQVERWVDAAAGGKDSPTQARKEPPVPQSPNLPTRIA
jgi:hypothetical protein